MPQASHCSLTPEEQVHLKDLLRRAVAKDKPALDQLLAALLPRLRDKVGRSLNCACRDAQSDVLNSAIRRVLETERKDALPDTLPRFLGWVGAIIRNRCHDEWGKRLRRPGSLDREVPDEDDTEKDRRAFLVWGALQLLPDHHRLVLEHTYYDDRSDRDIGERMGLSEGAVRVLRYRARKRLKGLLEDRHDD